MCTYVYDVRYCSGISVLKCTSCISIKLYRILHNFIVCIYIRFFYTYVCQTSMYASMPNFGVEYKSHYELYGVHIDAKKV